MIFVVFFSGAVIGITLFLISDYILYVQHERHFAQWEADGKPYGIFYIPKEAKGVLGMPRLRSWFSSQKRQYSLAFRSPEWSKTEPTIQRLLILFRCLLVIGLGFWIAFVYMNLTKYK